MTVVPSDLFEMRCDLDECDRQIAWLLARRSRTVAAIAHLKNEITMPPRDPEREAVVVDAALRRTRDNGCRYDDETIRAVYAAIFSGCERLTPAPAEAAVPGPVDGRGRRSTGY